MRAATPKNSGRSQKSLDSKAKNHLSNEWISLSTTNQVYNNYNVKLHPNILPSQLKYHSCTISNPYICLFLFC